MALKQENIIFNRTDENGNTVMQFPITTADNVEGLNKLTGISVGFQYFTTNPNIPVGELPLFGGEFSREAYADLWAWVQTQTGYLISEAAWQAKATANEGNVPFYSTGDGSTTFRVPSLSCWVRGANGVSEVGSYLKAGLPNIEGHVANLGLNSSEATSDYSGAFVPSASTINYGGSSSGSKKTNLALDASLSNPIYGNSDTVQPPSVVGMWLVKAFGTVSNIGNQDIADVSAGLTRVEVKMDEYTDNVAYIDSFIVESWVSNDGLSWYRKYNDGWIEQGGDLQGTTKNESRTVTLPTAFSNTNYTLIVSLEGTGSTSNDAGSAVIVRDDKTTTAFNVKSTDDTSNYLGTWYACGY